MEVTEGFVAANKTGQYAVLVTSRTHVGYKESVRWVDGLRDADVFTLRQKRRLIRTPIFDEAVWLSVRVERAVFLET